VCSTAFVYVVVHCTLVSEFSLNLDRIPIYQSNIYSLFSFFTGLVLHLYFSMILVIFMLYSSTGLQITILR